MPLCDNRKYYKGNCDNYNLQQQRDLNITFVMIEQVVNCENLCLFPCRVFLEKVELLVQLDPGLVWMSSFVVLYVVQSDLNTLSYDIKCIYILQFNLCWFYTWKLGLGHPNLAVAVISPFSWSTVSMYHDRESVASLVRGVVQELRVFKAPVDFLEHLAVMDPRSIDSSTFSNHHQHS